MHVRERTSQELDHGFGGGAALRVVPTWEHGPARPALRDDEVHVWLATLDWAEVWDSVRALASDERERAGAMPWEIRRDFMTSRALLREILGAYLEMSPDEVSIRARPGGKPELAHDAHPIRFNVSHSGGTAVVAVSRGREVGIDIAAERLVDGWERIADRVFLAEDAAAVHAAPPDRRAIAFARAWSRAEARLKTIGRGLTGGGEVPGEAGSLTTYEFGSGAGWAGTLAVEGRPRRVRWWRFEACVDYELEVTTTH